MHSILFPTIITVGSIYSLFYGFIRQTEPIYLPDDRYAKIGFRVQRYNFYLIMKMN